MEKTKGFLTFFRNEEHFDRLILDIDKDKQKASPTIFGNGTELYNSVCHLYSDFYSGDYETHVSTGLYLLYNKLTFVWCEKIDANLLDSIIIEKDVEIVKSSLVRPMPTVRVNKSFVDNKKDSDKIDICHDILSKNFPNDKYRIIPAESFESLISF